MPEAMSFNCPNCGSPLAPNGDAREIKCAFCGSTVIVPQELSGPDQQAKQEWDAGVDPFSPEHLQWLLQHGADATARIDSIKDEGKTVVLYWSGTKASGGQFKNHAEINRPSSMPKRGDVIRIKYNPEDKDEIDFAFEINGTFIRDSLLWE